MGTPTMGDPTTSPPLPCDIVMVVGGGGLQAMRGDTAPELAMGGPLTCSMMKMPVPGTVGVNSKVWGMPPAVNVRETSGRPPQLLDKTRITVDDSGKVTNVADTVIVQPTTGEVGQTMVTTGRR